MWKGVRSRRIVRGQVDARWPTLGWMKNEISVTVGKNEWGQILDGLRCRAEIYEETVRYYESGFAEHEIAEVRDVKEARELAELYFGIIGKIQQRLSRCVGSSEMLGDVYKRKRRRV